MTDITHNLREQLGEGTMLYKGGPGSGPHPGGGRIKDNGISAYHKQEAKYHENKAADFRGKGQHGAAAVYQHASDLHSKAAQAYRQAETTKDEEKHYEFNDRAEGHAEQAASYIQERHL